MTPKEIKLYRTPNGGIPFEDWFTELRDRQAQARIVARLDRLSLGNPGDCKSVGDGVFELRVKTGPGYRIYFGQVGSSIILLLMGGDKSTQNRDIKKAKEYWKDHGQR